MVKILRGILPVAIASFLSVAAHADFNDKQPIALTTSGATATGFGRTVVEALNAIVRDAYPGSTMTFRPNTLSGGMVDIVNGDAHLAIGPTNIDISLAVEGKPPFEKPMKGKLAYVFAGLPGTEFFIIGTKPWADAAQIKTLPDLIAKKPATTASFSARGTIYVSVIADALFKAGGSSLAQFEKQWPGAKAVYLPSARTLDDMKDGKIDFAIGTSFQPNEAINELARHRGATWVSVPDAFLESVAKQYDLEVVSHPKTFYPFLESDIKTLRINLYVLASTDVSEEAVYKYLKAIGANFERFRAIHPAYRNLSFEQLSKKPPTLDYHPGAARYFREVGYLK